jgi:transposase-like protein
MKQSRGVAASTRADGVFQTAMHGTRLARLANDAAAAPTPGAALRALGELRRELDAFERRQVAHALADGASFAAIARELGISRQAVHRRFRDVRAEEAPLLMARDVRRALRYAREEAQALGASEPGSEHVLLALMRAAGGPAAAALRAAGATLDRARTQVAGTAPDGRLFRGERDDLRALLAAPARIARARGAHRIDVADLLVAALEDRQGGAARTLRALGVDPATVRRELSRRRADRPVPTAPG